MQEIQETQVRSPDREGSPGGGTDNPLQYSCLENPMDREAWWATVHGHKESDTTKATKHKGMHKVTTTSQELLTPTEVCGSSPDTVVLAGS